MGSQAEAVGRLAVAAAVIALAALVGFLAGTSLRVGDPAVQAAVIGTFGVIVVALIGVGGVRLGAKIGADASREAAQVAAATAERAREDAAAARAELREDAALERREDRIAERRARFADRKAVLYTDLWIACDRHKREVEAQVAWRRDLASGKEGTDPGIGRSEPARLAFMALTLLGSIGAVAAAEGLYAATTALSRRHAYHGVEGQPVSPPNESRWLQDLEAWSQAAARFESEVQWDLGG